MSDRQSEELKKLNKTIESITKLNQEKYNQITNILYQLLNWNKIVYDDKIKLLLESILDEPKKIAVYQMSDGVNTTRIISKETSAGTGSVSRWWKYWIERGIATPVPKGTGFKAQKMFNLENYDFLIPDKLKTKEYINEELEE